MEIENLTKLAREVADAYDAKNRAEGRRTWTVDNYMSGFVGDVGDLSKLIMARSGYRQPNDVDQQAIGHELSDCLWSILILADELEIDINLAFESNMEKLLARVRATQGP